MTSKESRRAWLVGVLLPVLAGCRVGAITDAATRPDAEVAEEVAPTIVVVGVESWANAFGVEGVTLRVRVDDSGRQGENPVPDYLEAPVMVDDCVLGSGATLDREKIIGYPGGFEEPAQIVLGGKLTGETVVRRLAFDLAVTRIPQADVHRFVLEKEGDGVDLGHGFATGVGAERTKVIADWSYREGSLPLGFYEDPGRYRQDLFQIHDAGGRRVAWTGTSVGGGSETMDFAIAEPSEDTLQFPVRLEIVVPLRWETRRFRFVLEDVTIPPKRTDKP